MATPIVNDRGAGAFASGRALSVADLLRIAYTAGFRGNDLLIAVSIAMAESGGDPLARGDVKLANSTWGPSIGLWQIRSLNKDKGKGGLRDEQQNVDPLANARAAFALYQARKARGQRGFEDWTTFTGATKSAVSGGRPKYALYLNDVANQANQMGGENGVALQVFAAAQNGQPIYSGQSTANVSANRPQPLPQVPGTFAPAAAPGQQSGTPGFTGGASTLPGLGGNLGTAPIDTLPPNASEQQIVDFVTRNYGFMAWALRNPELRGVIINAAQQGFDANRLQGAIFATHWWQTHNEAARTFEAKRNMDPAAAEQELSTLATSVRVWASRQGIQMDQARARTIAEHALSVGMGEDEVRQNLVAELEYSPDRAQGGDIGANQMLVKQKAAGYLVKLSPETVFEWAKKMTTGEADEAGLTAYLAGMAKSRLPQLASQIDMGFTPQTILEPYQQMIASELEMSPGMVNFLDDPRFGSILSQPDPKTGQRLMSLSEAQRYVRTLPEFRTTQHANQLAASTGLALAQRMGMIGG